MSKTATALFAACIAVLGMTAKVNAQQTAASGWISEQAAGYYRFKLGDLKVTVLSDGTVPRELDKIMSKPNEVREAFDAAHEHLPTDVSINCFLVDDGSNKILVDTGAGELFGPPSGALVANMAAAGYKPEDIDTILLTHIHGDHSGGLSVGGRRVFPNATVYVDKRDPAFWLSKAEEEKAPKALQTTFKQSQQTVNPYVEAGRLKTFDGVTEVLAGITTVPEHGHTPGLTGYLFESKGERLLVWGDIIHAAEIQFRDPTVTIQYDVNPSDAMASRERVLAQASKEGYLIGGAHISFPGLGHVRREVKNYSWAPLPYAVDLKTKH